MESWHYVSYGEREVEYNCQRALKDKKFMPMFQLRDSSSCRQQDTLFLVKGTRHPDNGHIGKPLSSPDAMWLTVQISIVGAQRAGAMAMGLSGGS